MKFVLCSLLCVCTHIIGLSQVTPQPLDSLMVNWNQSLDSLNNFKYSLFKFYPLSESNIESNGYRDSDGTLYTLRIKKPNGNFAAIRPKDSNSFAVRVMPTSPKKK